MKRFCRLCLKLCDDDFKKIDEVISEIMDVLLLKLSFDVTTKPQICRECSKLLEKCFHFKSTCFYTEEFIFPCINPEDKTDPKLDLKVLFIQRTNLDASHIPTDHKMCRFCMELGPDRFFYPLSFVDEGMLGKCLPELTFTSIKVAVICKNCHENLEIYSSFIETCVQTEGKLKKYNDSRRVTKNEPIVLSNVVKFLYYQSCKDKISKNQSSATEVPDTKQVKSKKVHYAEVVVKRKNSLENGKLEHKFRKKRDHMYHYTEEEIKRKIYKCPDCTFRTDSKEVLRNHKLVHPDPAKTKWYSCEVCTYKTFRKHHLVRHVETHCGEPKKFVRVFKKCPKCDYCAPYPSVLKKHMRVHENPESLRVFDCSRCSYVAKDKETLKSHMRKHAKNCSYKCNICSFQTKYRESFRRHLNRHKDPSELRFLYCAECEYKTRQKRHLKIHILEAHTDP